MHWSIVYHDDDGNINFSFIFLSFFVGEYNLDFKLPSA